MRKRSRSKERYFSPRDGEFTWDIGEQPPEFWNQYTRPSSRPARMCGSIRFSTGRS